jgi:hypothetical protein
MLGIGKEDKTRNYYSTNKKEQKECTAAVAIKRGN